MMQLTKTQISTLNATARTDFPKAQAMLEGINLVLGTQYGWAAGRVVWFENPNGSTAEKYAHFHDAYPYGLEDKQPKRYIYTEKGAAAKGDSVKAGDIYDRPVSESILKQYVRAGFIAEVQ